MEMISSGYRGLSLLVGLNWDRLFYFTTIFAGLLAGSFIGTLLSQ
ncbi:MAG: hypothetical protein ACRCSU_09600 [Paracoccaceae bacterium]